MIKFNGTAMTVDEALLDAAFLVHEAGEKAVRAEMKPRSLYSIVMCNRMPLIEKTVMESENVRVVMQFKKMELYRDGAASLWTPFGAIRLFATDGEHMGQCTLFNEAGAVVGRIALSV